MQRAWRRFTFRQIFAYYRDTIQFREQGSAAELLKCINPREARLLDRAAQVHVRFRLGGMVFPPTVYYKIYAHGAVTDVGAYAPRDYTAARRNQPGPVTLRNHQRPAEARRQAGLA